MKSFKNVSDLLTHVLGYSINYNYKLFFLGDYYTLGDSIDKNEYPIIFYLAVDQVIVCKIDEIVYNVILEEGIFKFYPL